MGLVPRRHVPCPWKAALLITVIFLNETLWYVRGRAYLLAATRAPMAYVHKAQNLGIDRAFGTLIAGFGLKIALT